jgi:hypothetical protein
MKSQERQRKEVSVMLLSRLGKDARPAIPSVLAELKIKTSKLSAPRPPKRRIGDKRRAAAVQPRRLPDTEYGSAGVVGGPSARDLRIRSGHLHLKC